MPFKYLNIVQRIKVGVYSITSFIVLLFALFILIPMFTSNPFEEQGFDEPMGRAPAGVVSFHGETTSLGPEDREMVTLDLECVKDGKLKAISSRARQVRVVGKWCHSYIDKLEGSSIINRANGVNATMFHLKKGQFTSDYISLVPGENNIMVQLQASEDSKSLTELVVVRE